MERDESGRRWAEAYLLRPPAQRLPMTTDDPFCSVHPDTEPVRVLRRVPLCPACLRQPRYGAPE
ncbi:hypothetical protein [Streptomyces sp. NPDC045470]|uniref:hypothetical protein n=1 Tax=Streptomyces sp. NPDC045470 TaxID=3155469 RepID=UPI00340E493A